MSTFATSLYFWRACDSCAGNTEWCVHDTRAKTIRCKQCRTVAPGEPPVSTEPDAYAAPELRQSPRVVSVPVLPTDEAYESKIDAEFAARNPGTRKVSSPCTDCARWTARIHELEQRIATMRAIADGRDV